MFYLRRLSVFVSWRELDCLEDSACLHHVSIIVFARIVILLSLPFFIVCVGCCYWDLVISFLFVVILFHLFSIGCVLTSCPLSNDYFVFLLLVFVVLNLIWWVLKLSKLLGFIFVWFNWFLIDLLSWFSLFVYFFWWIFVFFDCILILICICILILVFLFHRIVLLWMLINDKIWCIGILFVSFIRAELYRMIEVIFSDTTFVLKLTVDDERFYSFSSMTFSIFTIVVNASFVEFSEINIFRRRGFQIPAEFLWWVKKLNLFGPLAIIGLLGWGMELIFLLSLLHRVASLVDICYDCWFWKNSRR